MSTPDTSLVDLEELRQVVRQIGLPWQRLSVRPLRGGRSGASTLLVSAGERQLVLRIQPPDRLATHFHELARVQRAASRHGLAPRLWHADLERRWLLVDHVDNQSLVARLRDPATGREALAALGRRLAELHELELPEGLTPRDPAAHAERVLAEVERRDGLPAVAREARADFLRRPVPALSPPALCHHDLNPSNLLFDGEQIWFVDWEIAGPGQPSLDLATLVTWLLLDEPRIVVLLEAYAGPRRAPGPSATELDWARRLVSLAYGATFLQLGEPPPEPSAAPQTLAACYAALGSGRLDLEKPAGRWTVGEAMFRHYLSLP